MPWILLLIPSALYSARLVYCVLRNGELQKQDRIFLGIFAGWIMIAASTPWVILTASQAHINNVEALYWHPHITWPVVIVHAWFLMLSVSMGLCLTFGRGAAFVVRHRRMLLIPMTTDTVPRYVGWAPLCYPAIYFMILGAVFR